MDDRRGIEAAGLAGSMASVAGVAAVGGLAVSHGRSWYRGLDKPAFTAPDGVFGPAWALLYANQAVASWLVWRGDSRRAEYDVPALSSYGLQLGLNLAWTLLFFGLRRPGLALLEICALWLAVAVTIRDFARKHRFAAALLVPYLAWVSYAAALNAAIWWRNR
jgi:tryptophan-rich sensory protein